MFEEVKKQEWWNKPGMMGHISARKQVEKVEEVIEKYVKTDLQWAVANKVFPQSRIDDSAWWNTTDKEIAQFRYVIKRIHKETAYQLLWYLQKNTGYLKTELMRIMEVLAFIEVQNTKQDVYLINYVKDRMFYGVTKEDATSRFFSYHFGLLKEKYQEFKIFLKEK